MQQSQSPLDVHRQAVLELVWSGAGYRTIAAQLATKGIKTSERSIRRALRRWEKSEGGLPEWGRAARGRESKAYTKVEGDRAEVASKPTTGVLNSPEELLVERGLSPDEWEVTSLIVNEWDGPAGEGEIHTFKQLKINCSRKKPYDFLVPAYVEPEMRQFPNAFILRGGVRKISDAKLVVFVGDQQAPYHNVKLHGLFCEWLFINQPDEGVLIGDTIDLPDISRHPENPEWHVSAQECVNAGFLLLHDYVECSPTRWKKLMGNHDERVRLRLLNYMTKLYDLRPADIPGEDAFRSVWDIRNILHLDRLGIELIEPNGSYTHAQVKVSPYLAARHGWVAKKGAGASALATLEQLGYSVVVGHTHRQGLVHKTKHDIDGTISTLAAVEAGCMCRIEEGLGYTVAPDWQNGFATATVWPDGTFKLDLATYVDGKLYWRDQRY